MSYPISIAKIGGTISLGLLTGTSYTLTTLSLPSLALLPSATLASSTLSHIQTSSTRQILTLSSISSLSLITAYTLASPRGKHPYLLWTALVSFLGGQGVEWWFNGFSRFPSLSGKSTRSRREGKKGGELNVRGASPASGSESGFIEIESETQGQGQAQSEERVNGEKVEMEMARERKVQWVRSCIAGLGFVMGVVGIWGDGA